MKLPCVERIVSKANVEFTFENFLLTKIRIICSMKLSWLIELHLTWSCSHLKPSAISLESCCTHHGTQSSLTLAYRGKNPVCFIICNLGFRYYIQRGTAGWAPNPRREQVSRLHCHMLLQLWLWSPSEESCNFVITSS